MPRFYLMGSTRALKFISVAASVGRLAEAGFFILLQVIYLLSGSLTLFECASMKKSIFEKSVGATGWGLTKC